MSSIMPLLVRFSSACFNECARIFSCCFSTSCTVANATILMEDGNLGRNQSIQSVVVLSKGYFGVYGPPDCSTWIPHDSRFLFLWCFPTVVLFKPQICTHLFAAARSQVGAYASSQLCGSFAALLASRLVFLGTLFHPMLHAASVCGMRLVNDSKFPLRGFIWRLVFRRLEALT